MYKPKTCNERQVVETWKKYQKTKLTGLEFGKACYQYREKYKSKGGHGSKGLGLVQLLHELGAPKRTAYYWIESYEISIGERIDDEPEVPRIAYVDTEFAPTKELPPNTTPDFKARKGWAKGLPPRTPEERQTYGEWEVSDAPNKQDAWVRPEGKPEYKPCPACKGTGRVLNKQV